MHWAWLGLTHLRRCPFLLVLVLAAQGSSNLYPLILRGPHEQLSLLPIFWKNPLKGDFLIVTSRLPILFLVSCWQLKQEAGQWSVSDQRLLPIFILYLCISALLSCPVQDQGHYEYNKYLPAPAQLISRHYHLSALNTIMVTNIRNAYF